MIKFSLGVEDINFISSGYTLTKLVPYGKKYMVYIVKNGLVTGFGIGVSPDKAIKNAQEKIYKGEVNDKI